MCFDVDSTVIEEEGIDMLAEFKGAGEAVAEWTKKYGYFFIYYVLQHYNCLCSPKYKHLTVEACTYHNRPYPIPYYIKSNGWASFISGRPSS